MDLPVPQMEDADAGPGGFLAGGANAREILLVRTALHVPNARTVAVDPPDPTSATGPPTAPSAVMTATPTTATTARASVLALQELL